MEGNFPYVSVVVPTYNRWNALERTLDALCAQDYTSCSYEIIVVDDCSNDSTEAEVRRYAENAPVPINYFRAPSRSGPGACRNIGINSAKGEIIALTDGDTIPVPGWMSSAIKTILEPDSDSIAAIEGSVIPLEGVSVSPFSYMTSNYSGGRYQCCSMFYRKSAILQAGGFDERFFDTRTGVHFREDLDLALTIIKNGGSIKFVPEAAVFHPPHQPHWRQPIDFMKRYIHDPLLIKKHKGSWRSLIDPIKLGPIKTSMPRHKLYALHLCCAALVIVAACISNSLLLCTGIMGAAMTAGCTVLLHWRICRRPAIKDLLLSVPVIILCPYVFALALAKGCLRAERIFIRR